MFTNLQRANTRKIVFQKNIAHLNEFIGYVESMDSNEIWPEHSLSIKKKIKVCHGLDLF